ncbi:MAG: HAMP domain-containing sensor histidine kinase [Acidobacteriota bacterium]|nr:HAMP domain-containing sensor histidine kinase [Acidobacteriota bacterium]MDQ7086428.1 HAMP domain-containing sensor histidine kinase [Acidobacteriota bacterium]
MERTRLIQIGFIVLLGVCAAQAGWWLLDQVLDIRANRAAVEEHLLRDRRVARMLLEQGAAPGEVEAIFDELIFRDGEVHLDPDHLAALHEQGRRRLSRYAWEGAFFLGVLLSGIVVLWRTLGEEALLKRRQQNFLAAVGHELKSPLASIRLAAETLKLRDPPPARRQKLLGRVLANLSRVEAMVRNLLDAARLDEGRLHLSPERVVLARAAHNAMAGIEDRLAAAGAELQVAIPEDLEVLADPAAVETVLANLVDNARKAVARAGGGRIEVRARRRGRRVEVEVRDEGVGFAPVLAPRLFDKFYRPGDEMRRSGEGSGLGLYIVRRLQRLAGGGIEAHSDGPGHGAVFTAWWPAAGGQK